MPGYYCQKRREEIIFYHGRASLQPRDAAQTGWFCSPEAPYRISHHHTAQADPCWWNWEAGMDASDLLGVQEAACFNIWHIWHECVNGICTVKKLCPHKVWNYLGRIYATGIKSSGNSLTFLRLIKFSFYLWKCLNICKVNARKNTIDLVKTQLLLFINFHSSILLLFTSGVKLF